jgi:hypothetical protein
MENVVYNLPFEGMELIGIAVVTFGVLILLVKEMGTYPRSKKAVRNSIVMGLILVAVCAYPRGY